MLEHLLFNKPNQDITITSYSEISDGTPQPSYVRKLYTEKEESITPQRINKLINWTKTNVTPGDAKNIFPQVQGPSIEFSNENSLNIKPQSKLNLNNEFLNKYIEMEEKLKLLQQKHQDYSTLEILRGKNLNIAQQKIQSQLEVIQCKDKIIDDLNLEIKKQQTIYIQQLNNKDSIIENQEQQITNLTNKLKKEIEYRKQDENLLSEIKLNEIKRSSVYEFQHCKICQSSKQELKNILQECSIEEETQEQEVPLIIREVVTLLLTKQREQIDIAFQEYEEQLRTQSIELDELKIQNAALLRDDNHLKQLSPRPLRSIDFDNMGHFKSIQTERSYNEISQLKLQIQNLNQKLQEQDKIIRQHDNHNSSNKKINQFKEQNEIKILQQQLKEKDKKNIDLFNQNKQLQKDYDQIISELKEELEKQKKKLQLKNTEIKQFIDQNKSFQDKNNELNQKILELQQQLINDDYNKSPNNQSIEQQRVISQYLQPNLTQLIEGYKSYQQEFIDLKQIFTEKLKQYEQLQTKIQQLQQENSQLCAHNQKLNLENQHIKEKSQKINEEIITGARCSAATGDSINIRSFTEEEFNRRRQINIFDLIQPELMSTEETLYILKEILIRSVKSFELIKRIYQIQEIRELLIIIQQVDEKYNTSNTKLTRVINSVLARKIKFQIQ